MREGFSKLVAIRALHAAIVSNFTEIGGHNTYLRSTAVFFSSQRPWTVRRHHAVWKSPVNLK